MTEENKAASPAVSEITPENVTKTQVDEFFDNGGKFKETDKPEKKAPSDKPTDAAKPEDNKTPPANDADKPDDKKVNYGAMHEERQRRKALQEENAILKKSQAETLELRKLFSQVIPQDQAPAFEKDPVAALKYELDQIKKNSQQRQEWEQGQQREQQFISAYAESTKAFAKDAPDYRQAYDYLMKTRFEELQTLGWDDEAAKKIIIDEEKWIVGHSYKQEVNPAERIYNLAMKRGYRKAGGEQTEEAPEPPANKEILDKLNNIEKGQKRNQNLPNGSKSLKDNLTVEDLAAMNPDTLNNLFGESDFDKGWNKIFNKKSA